MNPGGEGNCPLNSGPDYPTARLGYRKCIVNKVIAELKQRQTTATV